MGKTEKIWKKAKKTSTDRKQMRLTLSKMDEKLIDIAKNSNEFQGLRYKLRMLARMVKSHISQEYKVFPTSTIVLILFALIYFITPIDLIPDFIPALGFSDDLSVVVIIVKKLNKDIMKFQAWEEEKLKQTD